MRNHVDLIGHLGADPEIRKTQSGDTVANIRLATSERWRDKEGRKQERTEWHTLIMWAGLADVAEKYLKKGALVHVDGKLQTRKWTKDDQDHYTTEIVVSNLIMLDKKRDDREPGENG
jgi:single-strand DNA-binding protein